MLRAEKERAVQTAPKAARSPKQSPATAEQAPPEVDGKENAAEERPSRLIIPLRKRGADKERSDTDNELPLKKSPVAPKERLSLLGSPLRLFVLTPFLILIAVYIPAKGQELAGSSTDVILETKPSSPSTIDTLKWIPKVRLCCSACCFQ